MKTISCQELVNAFPFFTIDLTGKANSTKQIGACSGYLLFMMRPIESWDPAISFLDSDKNTLMFQAFKHCFQFFCKPGFAKLSPFKSLLIFKTLIITSRARNDSKRKPKF